MMIPSRQRDTSYENAVIGIAGQNHFVTEFAVHDVLVLIQPQMSFLTIDTMAHDAILNKNRLNQMAIDIH